MNTKNNRFKFFVFVFLFLTFVSKSALAYSDLNDNSIDDSTEDVVVVTNSRSLQPGEYFFNNLKITNNAGLYLEADEYSTSTFKGIKINATNIIVDPGSSLIANKGYDSNIGPGSGGVDIKYVGGSYGGVGYRNTIDSLYGSETEPVDLGSGGGPCCTWYNYRGGGAMHLVVSDTITNNGVISADGDEASSGGSIYVKTKNISGSGDFSAKGGRIYAMAFFSGPGGGGRIAIYYDSSSFSGGISTAGGCGSFDGFTRVCAGSGTIVFKKTENCTVNCNSNIMFLPGIMGSRLYEESGSFDCGTGVTGNGCFADNELWVSSADSNHEKMAMDSMGKSIGQIYTKDDTQNNGEVDETGIVDDIYSLNIYQTFISKLSQWKNNENLFADYAFIPYDWRLSLDDIITNGATSTRNKLSYTNSQDFSDSYILKKLRELQKTSRNGKVTIISHSNGGLVAKALIQKLKDTNDPLYYQIDKVILVAVPQIGTPEAVLDLLHGASLGGGLIMRNETSRYLVNNMPMTYNLIPSNEYFSTIDPVFAVDKIVSFEDNPLLNSYISKYGLYVSNPTELKNFVLGVDGRTKPAYADTNSPEIGNEKLYSDSSAVHSFLDSWQPASTTKVIQVAGWGEETLAGIKYSVKDGKVTINPVMVVDGDGTVVTPSALWMSTSNPNVERWWVDLQKYNSFFSLNVSRIHRDILEVNNLNDFLRSRIDNSNYVDNIITNNSNGLLSDRKRLHYTLHSPLTLGIVDSQGRYTGLDPLTMTIKKEIPGVDYQILGEVQFISVPEDVAHTVRMVGLDDGLFSLDIEKQDGNTSNSLVSFQAMPSSSSTIAILKYDPNIGVSSSTLDIDTQGDGASDISIKTKIGEVVYMPKPLGLVVGNQQVVIGAPMPSITWSLNGFIGIDTATSTVSGSPLCVSSTSTTSQVGNFTLSCSVGTLSSDKYYFDTFTPGILSIMYKFSGIKLDDRKEIFKVGDDVTFKFNLRDYFGKKVLSKSLPVVAVSDPGPKLLENNQVYNYKESSTIKTSKYNIDDREYSYVLKTKGLRAGYWYKIWVKLDDGNIYSVIIGLK